MLHQGESGRRDACTHVMMIYHEPLRIYFVGSSFRGLGDGDDIVRGFFADRLSRPEFLIDWMQSKRQLRLWLMTAFRHHLFELARRRNRMRNQSSPESPDAMDESPDAERAFHRSVALQTVRQAMSIAERTCAEASLDEHWRVFVRHHVDGRSYQELQSEFGLDEKKFKVMARTAGNKLRSALRELVRWEGASDPDIDRELHDLMEAITP